MVAVAAMALATLVQSGKAARSESTCLLDAPLVIHPPLPHLPPSLIPSSERRTHGIGAGR